MSAAASLAQKQQYLARVLARWSHCLAPVRSAPQRRWLGYRERVTLTARWDTARGWQFGLVRRDELIAIHDCPVHAPRVNRLVHCLRGRLPAPEVLPLAYLHVAGGQATLIVKARAVDPGSLADVIKDMPTLGFDGLWLHLHASAGRRLFARSGWSLLWGSGESTAAGGVVHGPTAFQQLLPDLHEDALDVAAGHLAPAPGVAVLDLYSGLGVSLRRWGRAGAGSRLGVELGGGSIQFLPANAPGAEVLRGTCAQRLPQIRGWWQSQAAPRVAYVNPPRSGLEIEVLQALAADLRPERLAYLSCSAGTLARDLDAFERHGYQVTALHPFDFFPGTHHVECLALLDRV